MFSETNISALHVSSFCAAQLGWFIIFVVPWSSILTLIFSLELRVITVMFCRSTLAHFVLVWLGNPQAVVIIRNSAFFSVNETSFVQHFDLSTENINRVRNRNYHSPALRYVRNLFFHSVGGQNKLCSICRFIWSIIRILQHCHDCRFQMLFFFRGPLGARYY